MSSKSHPTSNEGKVKPVSISFRCAPRHDKALSYFPAKNAYLESKDLEDRSTESEEVMEETHGST